MRPRIRTVKPEMRHDERYARLSIWARELFNGLITLADDEGRFRALPSMILGHVFPYDDISPLKLRKLLGEIAGEGMVVLYEVDGVAYGAFRHWRRHQKINRPTPSTLPTPPVDVIVRENSLPEHCKLTEPAVNGHGELTESSVSNHGALTSPRAGARSGPVRSVVQTSASTERSKSAKKADKLAKARDKASDDDRRLCRVLAQRVRELNPEAAWSEAEWLDEMRLNRERDHRTPEQTDTLLDWVFGGSKQAQFWARTIQSPAGLRRNWPRAWGDMLADQRETAGNGHALSTAALVASLPRHDQETGE